MNSETLIIENLDLVKIVVYKNYGKNKIQEDLIGYGYFGLINAARRFNPDKNNNFRAYASQKIKWSILDGLRENDYLNRSYRKKINHDIIHINYDNYVSVHPIASRDSNGYNFGLEYILDNIKNPRTKKIFELYSQDYTMKEIGKQLNLTESRISQIFKREIKYLRKVV